MDQWTDLRGVSRFFSESFCHIVRPIAPVEPPVQTWSDRPAHGELLSLQAPWNHGASPLSPEFLSWPAPWPSPFPWLALCGTAVAVSGACPYVHMTAPVCLAQTLWHSDRPHVKIPGFPCDPRFSPKPSQCRWLREVKASRFTPFSRGSELPAGMGAELDFALVGFSCLLFFVFPWDKNHPGFHCLPPCRISLGSLVFQQCHLFSFVSLWLLVCIPFYKCEAICVSSVNAFLFFFFFAYLPFLLVGVIRVLCILRRRTVFYMLEIFFPVCHFFFSESFLLFLGQFHFLGDYFVITLSEPWTYIELSVWRWD